jgi:hypothetical protein
MAELSPREELPPATRKRLPGTRLTTVLQVIVAVLGAVQTFFWRNTMDADGMSYIDVARAYSNQDWTGAVNGYWSPLFSWLIAVVLGLFHPSASIEFPIVHALNFLDFLLALAAFSFFVRQLFARLASYGVPAEHDYHRAWLLLAYASFAYASLVLQDVGRGGPDFLLSACFYCAAGLMLRLAKVSGAPTSLMVRIGSVLGVGYLAKAVMFPTALIMLGCVALMLGRAQRRWLSLTLAVITFGAVATPWIVALSHAKGRLTYGDTGKLNYAWFVDDASIRHAKEDPVHGKPSHPTRRLSGGPIIYEFAEPVRGTYPVWYDPSYWHEGLRVRPHLRLQLHRLALSAEDFLNQSWFYPTLAALIALGLLAGVAAVRRALASTWFVIVPVVSGVGMYSLVLVLGRHIAPFFAVGLTTLGIGIAAAMLSAPRENKRAAGIIAAGLAATLIVMTLSQLVFVDRRLAQGPPPLEITARLHSYGVSSGSRVGVIGDSMHAYWAHLGRFRIVAEITPEETAWFWAQDESKRIGQLELFRRSGAVAVIADHVPSWADTSGWIPVGYGGYWAYLLRPATRTPSVS